MSKIHSKANKRYCPAVNDGFLCWAPTLAGEKVFQKCPPNVRLIERENQAFRICGKTGIWLDRKLNESGLLGWTNYTPCFSQDVQDLFTRIYNGEGEADEKFYVAGNTRAIEISGCSISFISLLISLIIYMQFPSLRNSRTRIHQHLFSSMTIQIVIRLVVYIDQDFRETDAGMSYLESMPYLCIAMYVMLEYAISVMLMWMFNEGLYLHTVLAGNALVENHSFKMYYLLGWGLPVVITGIWAFMTQLHYRTKPHTCWYAYNFSSENWILLAPRLAVMTVNLIFLLLLIRIIVKKMNRRENNEIAKLKKAVRAAFVLLPLLGITNVLNMIEPPLESIGLFRVWSYTSYFLRAYQGFFIAVIHCFTNAEVITVVRKYFSDRRAMRATRNRNINQRDSFRSGNRDFEAAQPEGAHARPEMVELQIDQPGTPVPYRCPSPVIPVPSPGPATPANPPAPAYLHPFDPPIILIERFYTFVRNAGSRMAS